MKTNLIYSLLIAMVLFGLNLKNINVFAKEMYVTIQGQVDIRKNYNWFPDKRLSTDNMRCHRPSIALDKLDNIHVIWKSSLQGIEKHKIDFYQFYWTKSINGLSWDSPSIIYEDEIVSFPAVVLDDVGNISIIWGRWDHKSYPNGSRTEWVWRSYDGNSWLPEKIIRSGDEMGNRILRFNIVKSKRKGEIYAVFSDYSERHYFPYILAPWSGHTSKAFAKLFLIKWNGKSWSEPQKITDPGRFNCSDSAITLDGNGILHVVWVDERLGYNKTTIYYDRFDGKEWGGNERLSEGIYQVYNPSIISDIKNNIHIIWGSPSYLKSKNPGMYYRQWDGSEWSDIIKFSEEGGVISSVATDGFGNIHIVWSQDGKIYYKVRTGSMWTKTIVLHQDKAESPDICIDRSNNIHIVWIDRRHGQRNIYYKKLEYKR